MLHHDLHEQVVNGQLNNQPVGFSMAARYVCMNIVVNVMVSVQFKGVELRGGML